MPLGKRVQLWIDALHGPKSTRRTKAAASLRRTSEHYFDDKKLAAHERRDLLRALEKLVPDEDPAVREVAGLFTGYLKHWCEETERIVSTLLRDAEPAVRKSALFAAGQLGESATSLVAHVVELARDPDEDVRWRVAWALREVKCANNAACACLRQLSDEEDVITRMYAVEALPGCCGCAPNVCDLLVERLTDPTPQVRGAACRALAKTGDARSSTLRALHALVEEQASGVKCDAVYALTRLDPRSVEEPRVRAWLEGNRGYWWVLDLIDE